MGLPEENYRTYITERITERITGNITGNRFLPEVLPVMDYR